jgi:hypothetical protein
MGGLKHIEVQGAVVFLTSFDRDLQLLLVLTRKHQTSEPQDKLFTILGLAGDLDSSLDLFDELNIDYAKPTENVFADCTRYIVRKSHNLEILDHVEHGE